MSDVKETKQTILRSPGYKFYEQATIDGNHVFVEWENYAGGGGEAHVRPTIYKSDVEIVPLDRTPWYTASSVSKCIYSELWDEIRGYIYEHVDLTDERLYDVLTSWVFSTWIPEAFTVIAYMHILGTKSVGKSRLMEVLRQISYRGVKSSDVSNSAMYRIVEKWKPTLFFDEAEIYNKGLREDIQGLFNSGYTRGDFIIRVKDPKTDELSFFETYGFKVFAGTEQLRDTLESRCIQIGMVKNSREIRFEVDSNHAQLLRDKLLYWRFNVLAMLERGDLKDLGVRQDASMLSPLDGRQSELYSGLVLVAKLVELK